MTGPQGNQRSDVDQTHRGRRQCRTETHTCYTQKRFGSSGKKKSSTPNSPDRITDKGGTEKNVKTKNTNLTQEESSTSYFDTVRNVLTDQTDGSIQWIPTQIVVVGVMNLVRISSESCQIDD